MSVSKSQSGGGLDEFERKQAQEAADALKQSTDDLKKSAEDEAQANQNAVVPTKEEVSAVLVRPDGTKAPDIMAELPERPIPACEKLLTTAARVEDLIKGHRSLDGKQEVLDEIGRQIFHGRMLRDKLQRFIKQKRIQMTLMDEIKTRYQIVRGLEETLPRELDEHEMEHPKMDDIIRMCDQHGMWMVSKRTPVRVKRLSGAECSFICVQTDAETGEEIDASEVYKRRGDYVGEFYNNEPFIHADDGQEITLEPLPEMVTTKVFFINRKFVDQNNVTRHSMFLIKYDKGGKTYTRLMTVTEFQTEFQNKSAVQVKGVPEPVAATSGDQPVKVD